MIDGRISYNADADRYGVLVSDLWRVSGLHCGDRLRVMIDASWQPAHMEYDHRRQQWYLILDDGSQIYGNDMEYMRVQIDD